MLSLRMSCTGLQGMAKYYAGFLKIGCGEIHVIVISDTSRNSSRPAGSMICDDLKADPCRLQRYVPSGIGKGRQREA
jgi:hypothetical protein